MWPEDFLMFTDLNRRFTKIPFLFDKDNLGKDFTKLCIDTGQISAVMSLETM